MDPFVFICYSRDDNAYVQGLASSLSAQGVSVWFDDEILTGDQWQRMIERQIESCSAFMVVMTKAARSSDWVTREINWARQGRKRILPLLLGGKAFFELSELDYEDVRDQRLPSPEFVATLRRILAQASTEASPPIAEPPADQGRRSRLGHRVIIGDPGREFYDVDPELMIWEGYTPDTAIDGGSFGPFDVRAASVRGIAHRRSGHPRQDAYGMCADRNRLWLVVAVADGAPDGDLSHGAAQLLARRGPQEVIGRLVTARSADLDWYNIVKTLNGLILEEGRRRLRELGRRMTSQDYQMLSTTLTLAVCSTNMRDGSMSLTAVCLGDSPIWLLDATNGELRCLTTPVSANRGIPRFLSASLPQDQIDRSDLFVCKDSIRPNEVLLVMTDGIADPLGDGSGDVGRFLSAAWRTPPSLLEFAEQVAFGRKAYYGDRTVVGVWPSTSLG